MDDIRQKVIVAGEHSGLIDDSMRVRPTSSSRSSTSIFATAP